MASCWGFALPAPPATWAGVKALQEAEKGATVLLRLAESLGYLKAESRPFPRTHLVAGARSAVLGCQAITFCWDSPSLSIPSSTRSPAFRYCGGRMPNPTPAGVP